MRIQASLEFVLIASALAVISLSVISVYGKDLAAQKTILAAVSNDTQGNYSVIGPQNDAAVPQIAVYVPVNSTAYSGSDLQVTSFGCNHGAVNVTLNSTSVFFPRGTSSARISGVAVLSFPFEPLRQGLNAIDVRYVLSCGNATEKGAENFSTYASAKAGNEGVSYSAYLSNRSEMIEYDLGAPAPIINLTGGNHCTTLNFWGNPLPTSDQCGTSSWGYMVFSDYCYTTKEVSLTSTYCVTPVETGYSLVDALGSPRYSYSFSLALSSPFGNVHATIDGSNASRLMLGNDSVGNVSVEEVSFSGQAPGATLVSHGGNYAVANQTALSQYLQEKGELYGILSYYNSTEVEGPTQSSIEQSIYSFVEASNALRSASPANAPCNVAGGAYVCPSPSPLTYLIDVSVSPSILVQNQTLYYDGSEINLFRE
jgi:hypothetical protein